MAHQYEKSSALPAAEPAPAPRQHGGAPAGDGTCAADSHSLPAVDHPSANRGPVARCGSCGEIVTDIGLGRSTRCGRCRRSLTVPSHIQLACSRCGHSQRVHLRKLDAEWLCCNCGQSMTADDLTLTPRHWRGSHRHRHGRIKHADAAWAVAVLALTLLIALLGLIL